MQTLAQAIAQFLSNGGTIVRCKTATARGVRYFCSKQRSKHCGKANYYKGARRKGMRD
jgi:hypothetical protein